jgi:hypothetical protein
LGLELLRHLPVDSMTSVKLRVVHPKGGAIPTSSSKPVRSPFRSHGDMCFIPAAFSMSIANFFDLMISAIAALAISCDLNSSSPTMKTSWPLSELDSEDDVTL